jgi:surface antigen
MEKPMASRAGHWRALARAVVAAALCLGAAGGSAAEDPRDAAFLAPVLQRALETARTALPTSWRNPATGNGGSIVVERTFYREPQTPCRDYVRTIIAAGAVPQLVRGTGCRSSTGLWLIEEEPAPLARGGLAEAPDPDPTAAPAPAAGPEDLVEAGPEDPTEAGPSCPDTVLVPMPAARPPALAYTLPSRAEL